MNKITAHMIVQNEEQWIWYALNSVIEHVDSIIIYDTGSTDNTVGIIKSIKNSKIKFTQKNSVAPKQFTQLRNQQIAETKTSWFMLLDGDEVWPENSSRELLNTIKNASKELAAIVIKAQVPVGDLFHYQPESAGRYHILRKIGHYNIRAYKKLSDYKWQRTYPLEAYQNSQNIPIQSEEKKLILLKNTYWHLTHLHRSPIDTHRKLKLEIGQFKKLSLPEIFYLPHPPIVPSPWVQFSFFQKLTATILTPMLYFKRRFL